jgi:hypothetical protein
MWQKDSADVNRNGSIGAEDCSTWQAALKYCESLDFGGHDDWRLPNVLELQSIVDYGSSSAPMIYPVFGALPNHTWSSTSAVGNSDYAWGVHFGYRGGNFEKSELNPFRAVRAAR